MRLTKSVVLALLLVSVTGVAAGLQLNSSEALRYSSGSDIDFEVLGDGSVNVMGDVDLGGNDLVDGGSVIWDASNSFVPQGRLESDAVTVAGNSVSLGGSTGVAHGDLSGVGVGDHHPQILTEDMGTTVIDGPTVMDFRNALSVTNPTGNEIDVAVSESDISHDNIGGVSSGDHHSRYSDSEARGAVEAGNVDHVQFSNIESVSDGQIGRDNSIGFLGAWGSNGNAVLWDAYNVQEGNAISVTGGTGNEDNPTIAVNEGGISHDNIGGVSSSDHHTKTTDHGSLNGLGDNDHSQYVSDSGDTMGGDLDVQGNMVLVDGAEGTAYQLRSSDNQASGVAVRTTSNPSDTLFTVESTGGATRFKVSQTNGDWHYDSLSVDRGNTDAGSYSLNVGGNGIRSAGQIDNSDASAGLLLPTGNLH